ncbi:MAG: flavin reductase family protein, partial [Clostridia bacterium]|nr:flavin reductase family protein [Clostridia bacterium]
YYGLCFFGNEYKKVLSYCGTHSGKDVDKITETGLSVISDKAPYFKEAKLVLICKKIYTDYIDPNFFEESNIQKNYENNDYHKMYVGEIIKCLERE